MKKTYALSSEDRADVAATKILATLLEALRANLDGVIGGSDIEYLHDLRVANRRTRTFLSQIKGVIPKPVVGEFAPDFKRLGALTGPCRDLDVAVFDLERYRRRLEIDRPDLAPVQQFLEDRRGTEQLLMASELRSAAFREFLEKWARFLQSVPAVGEDQPHLASSPVADVAGPSILRAAKRVWKKGSVASADSPAALLHRLRIDGKKLRYLLEFFSELYPPTTIDNFIRELKKFQDILGEFNDARVQLALIEDAMSLSAHPAVSAQKTLAAVDRLKSAIAHRQRQLRANFGDRFERFASDKSRKRYRETFSNR
jgi:CHAD domain-containing protein